MSSSRKASTRHAVPGRRRFAVTAQLPAQTAADGHGASDLAGDHASNHTTGPARSARPMSAAARAARARAALVRASGTAASEISALLLVLPDEAERALRAAWAAQAAQAAAGPGAAAPLPGHAAAAAFTDFTAFIAGDAPVPPRLVPGLAAAAAVLESAGGVLPAEEWLARLARRERLLTVAGAEPATAATLAALAAVAAAVPGLGLPAIAPGPVEGCWSTDAGRIRWATQADAYETLTAACVADARARGALPLDALDGVAPLGVPHLVRRIVTRLRPDWPKARAVGRHLVLAPADPPPPRERPARTESPSDRVVRALALAPETVAAEITALLTGLDDRVANLCRLAWEGTPQGPLTLAAMAAALGVSGERVRQMIARTQDRLRKAQVQLPGACRAIEALDAVGGTATTSEWLARVTALEAAAVAAGAEPTTAASLRALDALSRASLVPPVTYDRVAALWRTPAAPPPASREARAIGPSAGQAVSWRLETFGALPLRDLPDIARHGAEHLLAATFLTRSEALHRDHDRPAPLPGRVVRGWFVPDVAPERGGATNVGLIRLLAVTGPMPAADIWRALSVRRLVPYGADAAGERATFRDLPLPVLRAVLRAHPAIRRVGDRYGLRTPVPADAVGALLPGAERAVYEYLVARGGIARRVRVARALEQAGYDGHATHVLLRYTPWLIRPERSMVALRNHAIDPLARARAHRATRRPVLRVVGARDGRMRLEARACTVLRRPGLRLSRAVGRGARTGGPADGPWTLVIAGAETTRVVCNSVVPIARVRLRAAYGPPGPRDVYELTIDVPARRLTFEGLRRVGTDAP